MRTFTLPKNVVLSTISISMIDNSTGNTADASWKALAALSSSHPDLMDAGLTGNENAITRDITLNHSASSQRGIELSMTLFGYNMTVAASKSLLEPLRDRIVKHAGNYSLSISISDPATLPSYSSLFDKLNPEPNHPGDISLVSRRLLGRSELTEISLETLQGHLQNITKTQVNTDHCRLMYGLQGGLGPRNVDMGMRGALTPAWRKAYIHLLGNGATVDTTNLTPQEALSTAGAWTEENKESV